ncbi:hypothetical protein JZ751_022449, partial [Albula glossodonta]
CPTGTCESEVRSWRGLCHISLISISDERERVCAQYWWTVHGASEKTMHSGLLFRGRSVKRAQPQREPWEIVQYDVTACIRTSRMFFLSFFTLCRTNVGPGFAYASYNILHRSILPPSVAVVTLATAGAQVCCAAKLADDTPETHRAPPALNDCL